MTGVSEIEEIELVNRCIEQDRRAQKYLYDKYKRAMFTRAYRILNDQDNANDALQEAFIDVFKDMRTFKFQSTLGAWIKTIVIRKAIKKSKLENRFEELEVDKHDKPVEWPDTITGEYLDKAIRSLPEGYRAVFTLIEVEGYAHKEVAAMLGISEGTSKSQLFHSKKMLQKLLVDLYDERR